MIRDLTRLPPRDKDGNLLMVVEAPRGSGLKLRYDPKLRVFMYGKALPAGLTYPYDWGFVPGTEAEDGDPIDVLALADVPSHPGVVIPCRPVGMVQLDEKNEKGKRERNDRIVAVPIAAKRFVELKHPGKIPKELCEEIEKFLLDTTFHSGKAARVLGWKGPRAAQKKVRDFRRR